MWSVHCEDIFMLFSETLVYEIIIPHNRRTEQSQFLATLT